VTSCSLRMATTRPPLLQKSSYRPPRDTHGSRLAQRLSHGVLECGRTLQREHWQEDNDDDGRHSNAHIDVEHTTHSSLITHVTH